MIFSFTEVGMRNGPLFNVVGAFRNKTRIHRDVLQASAVPLGDEVVVIIQILSVYKSYKQTTLLLLTRDQPVEDSTF
jgi:hypothetical protein